MKTENLSVRSRMFDFSYHAERFPQVFDAMFELASMFRVANSNEQSRHLDYKGDGFDTFHELFQKRYEYYDEEYDTVCELIRQGYVKCNLNLQKCIELAKMPMYDVSQCESMCSVVSASHADAELIIGKAEEVINLIRFEGCVKLEPVHDEMVQIVKYLNKSNWLLRSNLPSDQCPKAECTDVPGTPVDPVNIEPPAPLAPQDSLQQIEPINPPEPLKPVIPPVTTEPPKATVDLTAIVKPRMVRSYCAKPVGMPPKGTITVTQRTITAMPESKNMAVNFINSNSAPEPKPMNLDKVKLFLSKLGIRGRR